MLVANNVLYIQSGHQQTATDQGGNKQYKPLLALNATSGHLLWSVNVVDDGPSSLVFSNNLVILYRTISQPLAAEFCAYRSSDGSQAWCTSGKEGPGDQNTSDYLVANDTLYVSFATDMASSELLTNSSNPTTIIEALNPQTGATYWSKQVSGSTMPGSLTELKHALPFTESEHRCPER